MQFAVLSLFPQMFSSPFAQSIIGKAVEKGLLRIEAHQLRDYAQGRHQVTDDAPYGGGDGMVMKPEPVCRGIEDMRQRYPQAQVVLLTPQGRMFNQAEAQRLASHKALVLVCGRYEGFDERIRTYVDAEYSIGDYVLTGGELPAMVIIDAVARLVPGVLGNAGSAGQDSHSDGLLEFPHYTRPVEFDGQQVPEVLLSGNHAHIEAWRRKQQLERTKERRPDLWQRYVQQDGNKMI
ncbi:MAG: tRNA (guanosine(37)-N1)-methyltransferase TrmD [Desulfuromonas sp.]